MVAAHGLFQPGINRLLAALPRSGRGRLLSHLEPVPLSFEEVLYEPNEPIRHVYFPTRGMISLLLVLSDGSVAEVGRVGNEGMVGLPVFLGMRASHGLGGFGAGAEGLGKRQTITTSEDFSAPRRTSKVATWLFGRARLVIRENRHDTLPQPVSLREI